MTMKLNDHIHSELFDKDQRAVVPSVDKSKPVPTPRYKTDYTKPLLWASMIAITVVLWTIIYNLIF